MKREDFNKQEMSYLTDFIKFADTKAGVLVGFDSLLVKVAFGNITPHFLRTFTDFTDLLGLLILFLAILFALLVVFPRTRSKPHEGFIFWENIIQFKTASRYESHLSSLDENEIDRIAAEQNFHLAVTANRKYRMLKKSFWYSAIGSSLVLLSILIPYLFYI
jgi:hypothetical protein